MTAADNPEQITAAREAVEQGMATAEAYWQAAAAAPGRGLAVALPSVPDAQGRRPQGLGFGDDVPADALRPGPERPRFVPDGASPVVGGAYHTMGSGAPAGMDGVAWPAGQTQPSSMASRASSVLVVSASAAQESWPRRLAATIKRALGL
jgi:hypothetical protein